MNSGQQRSIVEALLSACWRRKWQAAVPAVIVAAAAAWWTHRLPDRYRSDAVLLLVSQRVPETFVRSTVASRTDNRLQAITQQILSRTQLEKIIAEFDLYADERKTAAMEEVVESMRARDIDVQPLKGDAFKLAFTAADPHTAMQVADRLASLFIGQASLDRATLAAGADRFLEAQLEDARRRLVENEKKLEDYRRRHNGELPAQLDANVQGLHNAEVQLQVLADSLNRDRDRRLALERSIDEAGPADAASVRGTVSDPAAKSAAEQLERAEASLSEMRSRLTPQHPDLIAAEQSVARLRVRAAEERDRRASAGAGAADVLRQSRRNELRASLAELDQQIATNAAESERLRAMTREYQRRIEAEPARESELAALSRDSETLQQTYRGLLAKKQESQIAADLERQQIGAQFKIVDPARRPERPAGPHRAALYAMSVCAGAGIGFLFALVLEYLDTSLRSVADVRAALGLEVLASIPQVAIDGPDGLAPDDPRLVGHAESEPLVIEQCRRLGAALHQAQAQFGIRTVAITSALGDEGKTLTATNIAITLSRSFGKRVLLVDGDMRKPAIHALFRVENGDGLTDVLKRTAGSRPAHSISPTLSVITAGRHDPEPVHLLATDAVQRFLSAARDHFDWIVVDTPPVALFPDAALLAACVDRCVLVVRAASTSGPAAATAVSSIGSSRILGVVLNRAKPADVAVYGYAQYGYAIDARPRDHAGRWRRARTPWSNIAGLSLSGRG